VAVLVLACFGGVLAGGEQFAFRDAGHFYGPLERRVQMEWRAGRWPLWEPEENGGMPLLGNPTAAVLYPGKLLFAVLPFDWAMRAYLIGHVLLAVAAMRALLRSFGVGGAGSMIGGIAYGFGGPVLFQYGNSVFLVGAAWMPLAFRAADRWIRQGRRFGIVELTGVLTMQVLGGDPQAAYLSALCAAGYAWFAARSGPVPEAGADRPRGGRLALLRTPALVLWALLAWTAATVAVAATWPEVRRMLGAAKGPAPIPLPLGPILWGAWGLVGLFVLDRWRRGKWRSPRARGLVGLAEACALAGGLAAVQLLPSAEFTSRSARAADVGPHDIYPFSLEPYRVVELAWPGFFGENLRANRYWLDRLPPAGAHKMWVPSLYLGGLTLVLAPGAFGVRGTADRRPRRWLAWVAVLGLWASCGEYGGPLWWLREVPVAARLVGPHDQPDAPTVRADGRPRDGDGSLYWLLATALPVFGSFRYPSKLLTLAALGLAGLAGLGWDDAASGRSRRARRIALAAASAGAAGLVISVLLATSLLRFFQSGPAVPHLFGPLDTAGALADLRRALLHGMIAAVAAWVVLRRGSRWPGGVAVLVLAVDLACANARDVITVPQSLLDARPKLLDIIEADARRHPRPGPYRVHRMTPWHPLGWIDRGAPSYRDVVAWEHDTLMPKYGVPYGLEYTFSEGTAELYDYQWFVNPFELPKSVARALSLPTSRPIVYYPRNGFDAWGTRYFVLPAVAANDVSRATQWFRGRADVVAKSEEGDWLVVRNRDAFPRAWAVHAVRLWPPIRGMSREERQAMMRAMLFPDDPGQVPDLRAVAWAETDEPAPLVPLVPGSPPDPADSVTIARYEPTRVEIRADLKRPGLVLLADVFYPGWTLTVDGRPAPILRANRAMRGALVDAGVHTLIYRYQPVSVTLGLWLTAAALVVLAGLLAWASRGVSSSSPG
jgi:hypothetical protein